MSPAANIANRGEVITLLYIARKMTGVNEKPPVDASIFDIQLVEKGSGNVQRNYHYLQSYSGGYIGFSLKNQTGANIFFTFTRNDYSSQATGAIL